MKTTLHYSTFMTLYVYACGMTATVDMECKPLDEVLDFVQDIFKDNTFFHGDSVEQLFRLFSVQRFGFSLSSFKAFVGVVCKEVVAAEHRVFGFVADYSFHFCLLLFFIFCDYNIPHFSRLVNTFFKVF